VEDLDPDLEVLGGEAAVDLLEDGELTPRDTLDVLRNTWVVNQTAAVPLLVGVGFLGLSLSSLMLPLPVLLLRFLVDRSTALPRLLVRLARLRVLRSQLGDKVLELLREVGVGLHVLLDLFVDACPVVSPVLVVLERGQELRVNGRGLFLHLPQVLEG